MQTCTCAFVAKVVGLIFLLQCVALFLWGPMPRMKGIQSIKNDRIWIFWDRPPIPPFIRLSIATVMCHNPEKVVLLTESNISEWISDMHPAFEYLIPAHKADYFRARILDLYGGMYLDADTIALTSFQHLFDKLTDHDLVNIDWSPDGDPIAITTMGPSRANSNFTHQWAINVHSVLDKKLPKLKRRKNYPIQWAEILRGIVLPIINSLLEENVFRYYKLSGPKTFGQLVVTGQSNPLQDLEGSYTFNETELLMYHNSGLSQNREMSVENLLNSNFLFGSLVRYSMNQCRNNRSLEEIDRNKIITIDANTEKNEDLILWIQEFLKSNSLSD